MISRPTPVRLALFACISSIVVLTSACQSEDEPAFQLPDAGVADESCSFGCFEGSDCFSGIDESACGSNGELCMACGSDQQCSAGDCVSRNSTPSSCDASNCDGCCDGDECRPGNADASCGSNGESCSDCGSRGTCEPGTRTCEVDPNSRWNVIAISAVLPERNEDDGTWDSGGGLPDSYAGGVFDEALSAFTDTIDNTLQPTWNQMIVSDKAAFELTAVDVYVFDRDNNADDLFGKCSLPDFAFAAFEGGRRKLTCSNGAGWELIVVLEPL